MPISLDLLVRDYIRKLKAQWTLAISVMRLGESIQCYLNKVEDVIAETPGTALPHGLLGEIKVHYVKELLHGNWRRYARRIARCPRVPQNFALFIEMI